MTQLLKRCWTSRWPHRKYHGLNAAGRAALATQTKGWTVVARTPPRSLSCDPLSEPMDSSRATWWVMTPTALRAHRKSPAISPPERDLIGDACVMGEGPDGGAS